MCVFPVGVPDQGSPSAMLAFAIATAHSSVAAPPMKPLACTNFAPSGAPASTSPASRTPLHFLHRPILFVNAVPLTVTAWTRHMPL